MNYLRPEKYDLMASWLNFHGKNYTATESEQSVCFFFVHRIWLIRGLTKEPVGVICKLAIRGSVNNCKTCM